MPVDVSVVLDRSGSMAGRKLDLARRATSHALQLLGARDRFAVTMYDNEVDALVGLTPATAESKQLAASRLRGVDARGSTELSGGWLRGAAALAGAPGPADIVRKVLLLTDGLANQGEMDPGVLAARASELRASGILTTTFGLGVDFDETLLSRMAAAGGGQFYYIEQAAQIADVFASELGETLEVVARDVRVLIAGDGMAIACLNGFASGPSPMEAGPSPMEAGSLDAANSLEISLGDMVADQQITVAIAVRVPASELGARRSVSVRVADRDGRLYPEPFPVEWHVVNAAQDASQPVSTTVLVEAATLLAQDARLHALEANRAGDFARARALIRAAAEAIRALGPGSSRVTAIADALEAEIDDFEVLMNPIVAKQRHFAARSLRFSRSAEGRARRTS
jgi:Ca-activated chloride channel family protein